MSQWPLEKRGEHGRYLQAHEGWAPANQNQDPRKSMRQSLQARKLWRPGRCCHVFLIHLPGPCPNVCAFRNVHGFETRGLSLRSFRRIGHADRENRTDSQLEPVRNRGHLMR